MKGSTKIKKGSYFITVILLRFLKSFEKSFFSNLAKVDSFQTPQIKNTVNAISIIDCIRCVFVIIITSKVLKI